MCCGSCLEVWARTASWWLRSRRGPRPARTVLLRGRRQDRETWRNGARTAADRAGRESSRTRWPRASRDSSEVYAPGPLLRPWSNYAFDAPRLVSSRRYRAFPLPHRCQNRLRAFPPYFPARLVSSIVIVMSPPRAMSAISVVRFDSARLNFGELPLSLLYVYWIGLSLK